METSPASRLPEVDSLPDGFLESSTDDDYKNPLLDVDTPVEPAGGRAEPATPPAHEIKPPDKDVKGDSWDLWRGSEGFLDIHTTELKEGSIAENEYLEDGKLGRAEIKHKVANHVVKQAYELLEFTLMHQNVIAERDAVRERLESLCRELQRQNKLLMDECQRVSTEGQNMRLDLATKFNDVIKDVCNKLEEQRDEYLNQLKENATLRSKLKHLADQHALSEQHFSAQLKQKTLELELADLKLQQQQERSAQEQTQLQLYVEQVTQLLDTEKNLRSQLAADGEKFQQFQDGLLKNNDVFETFKEEMEMMAKLVRDLKKENVFLKTKCEQSDIALAKLVENREFMKKQLEKVQTQKDKLETLCRSLQAERKQITVGLMDSNSVSIQDELGYTDQDS